MSCLCLEYGFVCCNVSCLICVWNLGQDGIVVKKVNDEEEEGMISNKRPLKASLSRKSMEYGCFVKVLAADTGAFQASNLWRMVMVSGLGTHNEPMS